MKLINNKIIKVLHCIHSLSGGGAERQLRLLSDASADYNIESAIFCANDNYEKPCNPTVKIFKISQSNSYYFSIFDSLRRAILEFKPDIIHLWLPEVITIPAQILSRMYNIPCLHSYRNKMFFYRKLSYVDFLLSFIFVQKIVSNNPVRQSNFYYRFLFHIKNGVEIHNSVLIDSIYKKNNYYINRKVIKLLFVGRVTKQKNWKCLLQAISLISSSQNYILYICGDGDEKHSLEQMVSTLGLNHRVRILGYCSNIYNIMKSSDLIIIPSLYEGMPNVLLESLTIGLPCLVSNISAHKLLINNFDCVTFFNPNSPSDLASKLDMFFNNREMFESKARNGVLFSTLYSTNNMVKKYRALYLSML